MKREPKFIRSLSFAVNGLVDAAVAQPNVRVHLVSMSLVGLVGSGIDWPGWALATMSLCVAAVLTAELLNTAIESTVDLFSPDRNTLARIAKDSAAAAVLVASTASVLGLGICIVESQDLIATQATRVYRQLFVGLPVAAIVGFLAHPFARPTVFHTLCFLGGVLLTVATAVRGSNLMMSAMVLLSLIWAFATGLRRMRK